MSITEELNTMRRRKVTRSFTMSPENGDMLDELANAAGKPASQTLDFILGRYLPGLLKELRKQQEGAAK